MTWYVSCSLPNPVFPSIALLSVVTAAPPRRPAPSFFACVSYMVDPIRRPWAAVTFSHERPLPLAAGVEGTSDPSPPSRLASNPSAPLCRPFLLAVDAFDADGGALVPSDDWVSPPRPTTLPLLRSFNTFLALAVGGCAIWSPVPSCTTKCCCPQTSAAATPSTHESRRFQKRGEVVVIVQRRSHVILPLLY